MTITTQARLAAGFVLLSVGGLLWLGRDRIAQWIGHNPPPRTYRMGWTDSPPFELRGADGQPSGFAVNLVRTAAARRGIRLQWVYWPHNSEVAFRRKVVDLWPFMTFIPDRLKRFYISEPYLAPEFCMLVRADRPFLKTQDLANASISFFNRPVDALQLSQHLPKARQLSKDRP